MAAIDLSTDTEAITASPAIYIQPNSFPNSQTANITAQFATNTPGSGPSSVMQITFDPPVSSVSFPGVGSTAPGGYGIAYNSSGQVVAVYFDIQGQGQNAGLPPTAILSQLGIPFNPQLGIPTVAYNAGGRALEDANGNFVSSGGLYNGTEVGPTFTFTPFNDTIASVIMTPGNNGYTAYGRLTLPFVAPVVVAPPVVIPVAPPVPVTPAPPAPPSSTINLVDIIDISVPGIQRTYVKGTMTASDPAAFTVTNTSPIITVQVAIAALKGITFNPTTFSLPPLGVQNVITTFDGTQEELLPEGANIVNAVFNLTSNTAVNQ